MVAEGTGVSEPEVGAALGVHSAHGASEKITTWSTVIAQPTRTHVYTQPPPRKELTIKIPPMRSLHFAFNLCTDLRLTCGVPSSLVILGQEQLLVQQIHSLLPLNVQSGPHPQRRLIAWLGALKNNDSILRYRQENLLIIPIFYVYNFISRSWRRWVSLLQINLHHFLNTCLQT